MLSEGRFTTSEYQIEDRVESGKMRRIYKLPYYPDRIVHHALMAVVGPIFRRAMIRDSFQSLPNRGTSDARRRVQKMMKSDPQKYALKMDIRLYYPSVSNCLLKKIIRKWIKCPFTLALIDNIIDSMYGLPIGGLPSQYFGNVFLTPFDWWVKQQLRVKYYYRYCDDLVLFSGSKAQLRVWQSIIERRLSDMGLTVKPDWQIIDTEKQGVDFVGYVFYPDKTKLRPSIAKNFKRHAKRSRTNQIDLLKGAQGLIAYKGWMMRANAKQLWRHHVPYKYARKCGILFKTNPLRGAI